jgi:two-component system nitrate/nitrite response regulator NarL
MRLVLCDDNRVLCEALAVALEARGHKALAIATTADEGVAAVARHQPDACLLDLRFRDGGAGVAAARKIWDRYPGTAVLVMSDLRGKAAALASTQINAAGFPGRNKDLDRITADLDAIAASRRAAIPPLVPKPVGGAVPQPSADLLSLLTPREREVLRRIAAGQGTKTMASEMNVTTETLRSHVKNVLTKLGAHSRLEAAAMAGPQQDSYHPEPVHEHPTLAALTPREREVLMHLMKGSGMREVAKRLHMSSKTINTHLHNLRSKLGVHSTLEAVALARAWLGRPSAPGDPDEQH